MTEVEVRSATADEIPDLAQLAILAGDGFFDAMYQGAVAGLPTQKIVERRFYRIGTTKSYENCWVAAPQKQVIGSFHGYPMDDAAADPADPLFPADRHYLAEPFKHLQASGSFRLHTIAVIPEYQGQGVGTNLLSFARSHSQEIGLSELSLIIFEQNRRAAALYERFGFRAVKRTPAPAHELIHYSGNLVLMTCPV